MGSKAPKSQTVTQRVEIPAFLRPFVEQAAETQAGALGNIENIVNDPNTNLVAGFTPAQIAAQEAALGIAGGEGGFIPTAQNALLSTAQGDFLAGGQGFNEAVQASINQAAPSILSAFGAAGRGVSGLGQAAIQRVASDAFASLFNNERNRQMAAAAALPGIGLLPSDIMSRVGGVQQAQAQREIEAPITAQERLLAAAQGSVPVTSLFGSAQTTPLHSNPLGGALGGGLAGLGAFGKLAAAGGPLAGTALGGGLGAGLFGGAGALLGLLSDEIEKEDIEPEADGPLRPWPVRSWRYRGEDVRRVGPIAQEVERIDPAAVVAIDTARRRGLLDDGRRKWVVA